MPFVHLQITRDGVTREQKAQVIAEITETLERVLNKNPQLTHIVIDEIDTDNWGWAGETTTVIRSRDAAGRSAAPAAEPAAPKSTTIAPCPS